MPRRRRYRRRYRRRFRGRRYRRFNRRRGYRSIRKLRNNFPIVPMKWTYFGNERYVASGIQQFWADSTAFSLAAIPSGYINPYVQSFDFYRIKRVKFEVFHNPLGGLADNWIDPTDPSPNGAQNGFFMISVDRNDVSVPTAFDYFAQTPSTKWHPLQSTKPRLAKVYFRPSTLSDVSDTATRPIKSPWLGTDNDSIPHYGIKYGIWASYVPTPTYVFDLTIKVTYYVQFKSRTPQ